MQSFQTVQNESRKLFGDISNENCASGKRFGGDVDGHLSSLKVKSRFVKSPVPQNGILSNGYGNLPMDSSLIYHHSKDNKMPILKSIPEACPLDWNPVESFPDEDKEMEFELLPQYKELLSRKRMRLT